MNAQVLFNQFAYADRLKNGGFSDDQARASAEALASALSEAVATKSDVASAKGELKIEIAALRSELKADIAALRGEVGALDHKMEARIEGAKTDLLFKLVGFQLAIAGLIVAAIKLIH